MCSAAQQEAVPQAGSALGADDWLPQAHASLQHNARQKRFLKRGKGAGEAKVQAAERRNGLASQKHNDAGEADVELEDGKGVATLGQNGTYVSDSSATFITSHRNGVNGPDAAEDEGHTASPGRSSPAQTPPASARSSCNCRAHRSPVLPRSSSAHALSAADRPTGYAAPPAGHSAGWELSGWGTPRMADGAGAPSGAGCNGVVFGSFDGEEGQSGEESTALASALCRSNSSDAGGMVFVGRKVRTKLEEARNSDTPSPALGDSTGGLGGSQHLGHTSKRPGCQAESLSTGSAAFAASAQLPVEEQEPAASLMQPSAWLHQPQSTMAQGQGHTPHVAEAGKRRSSIGQGPADEGLFVRQNMSGAAAPAKLQALGKWQWVAVPGGMLPGHSLLYGTRQGEAGRTAQKPTDSSSRETHGRAPGPDSCAPPRQEANSSSGGTLGLARSGYLPPMLGNTAPGHDRPLGLPGYLTRPHPKGEHWSDNAASLPARPEQWDTQAASGAEASAASMAALLREVLPNRRAAALSNGSALPTNPPSGTAAPSAKRASGLARGGPPADNPGTAQPAPECGAVPETTLLAQQPQERLAVAPAAVAAVAAGLGPAFAAPTAATSSSARFHPPRGASPVPDADPQEACLRLLAGPDKPPTPAGPHDLAFNLRRPASAGQVSGWGGTDLPAWPAAPRCAPRPVLMPMPAGPPPPPPRAPPPMSAPSWSNLQRQGSYQVPDHVQPTGPWGSTPPATDIERFLAQATPVLGMPGPRNPQLLLADFWNFFHHASLFGREVLTLGGSRGGSLAYYVPSLSACQLFLPAAAPGGCQPRVLYEVSGPKGAAWPMELRLDGWPRVVRPLFEYFDNLVHPYDRGPLCARVAELARSPLLDGLPGRLLLEQPLSTLHPASWVAISWHPVYRIPDAPLAAQFLTYHSLRPTRAAATHFGALVPGTTHAPPMQPGTGPPPPSGPLCLPILGLSWRRAEGAGETWFDPPGLERAPSDDATSVASNSSGSGSGAGRSGVGPAPGGAPGSGSSSGLRAAAAAGWAGSEARRARLGELRAAAERLSRGYGLAVVGGGKLFMRHQDFEYTLAGQ